MNAAVLVLGAVLAGQYCPTKAAVVSYGKAAYSSYGTSYVQPHYQAYYTPVVKEVQYVVAAPAYYGSDTQYAGEQYREKVRREIQQEERLKSVEQMLQQALRNPPQEQVQLVPQAQPQPHQAPTQTFTSPQQFQPLQPLTLPQKIQPTGQGGWPPVPGGKNPAPLPPPNPQPGVPGHVPGDAARLVPPDQVTLQVLEAKCSKCHNPNTARGEFILFVGQGQLRPDLTPGEVALIDQRVSGDVPDGIMPPPETGVSVSNEEYQGIKAWKQANADGIAAMLRTRR